MASTTADAIIGSALPARWTRMAIRSMSLRLAISRPISRLSSCACLQNRPHSPGQPVPEGRLNLRPSADGTARVRRAGAPKRRTRRGERRTRRRAAAPGSAVRSRLRSSECPFEKPTVLQTAPYVIHRTEQPSRLKRSAGNREHRTKRSVRVCRSRIAGRRAPGFGDRRGSSCLGACLFVTVRHSGMVSRAAERPAGRW